MNATTETLPAIRRVLPEHGRADRPRSSRVRATSPSTRPSTQTMSGRCCRPSATPARRRSSCSRSSGSSRERRRARRRDRRRGADRRRRSRPWRCRTARVDGALRRPAPRRVPGAAEPGSRRRRVEDGRARGVALDDPRRAHVQRGAAAPSTPRSRLRRESSPSGAGSRSTRSASACRAGASRCPPRS